MKKTYLLKTDFGDYEVFIETDNYTFDGSLYIELVDAHDYQPVAVLTVCIADDLDLPYFCVGENRSFVDTNNCSWAEKFIQENNLGKFTGITKPSGYCEFPLYEFDLEKLAE